MGGDWRKEFENKFCPTLKNGENNWIRNGVHKINIFEFIESLLSENTRMVREEMLVPFSFLQVYMTTLLLERNTYNREDEVQEILSDMQESLDEIYKVLSNNNKT